MLACHQALIISTAGRAFLRLRENLRRVAERFAGGLDHLQTSHRLLLLIEGLVLSVLVGLSDLLSFLFQ